jgi:hypothetical protein
MSDRSSELVEISKLNGDFRRNYGKLIGAFLYLRSISAARARPLFWTVDGKESSSPRVDEGRCSNNEDDGKSQVMCRQYRKSAKADPRCHQCDGGKAGRFVINTRLN